MDFSFCWEFNACGKNCPVRNSRSLFCWHAARADGFQTAEACETCEYRQKWLRREFSLQDFIRQHDRRKSPRRSRNVLVIDDEPNIRYALEETVRSKGHDCIGAVDGEEGLFLAREVRPDLILTDVILPKLSGYELCELVKEDGRTHHIPVVIITVRGREADIAAGLRSGADAYLVKPFHVQELAEHIDSFLTSKPERQDRSRQRQEERLSYSG